MSEKDINWESLATAVEETAYKEVKQPNRTHAQKMRDLISEMEKENGVIGKRIYISSSE